MNLKYMEWNLHAMGGNNGYSIPDFIADEIIKRNAHIVVLVEFCVCENWSCFKNKLEEHYDLFCSVYAKGYNQVCIAVKKNLFEIRKISAVNALSPDLPEYLQIDATHGKTNVSIIGTRIKTQVKNRHPQYDFLKAALNNAENVICLGDFNMTSSYLQNKLGNHSGLTVFGPRTKDSLNWSYVIYDKKDDDLKKWGLDLLITKGKVKAMKTTYDSKTDAYTYADYQWDFVTQVNGYKNYIPSDELSKLLGLPDHAVLFGEVEI